jgi:hypothetical protein
MRLDLDRATFVVEVEGIPRDTDSGIPDEIVPTRSVSLLCTTSGHRVDSIAECHRETYSCRTHLNGMSEPLR